MNTDNLQAGAFILECVGEQEDLPALVAALDVAVAEIRNAEPETWIYPRPRGPCQELVRAATMLNQRFEPSPKPPGSAGEAVVYLNALGTRESFRPPDWEKTVASLLGHETPYVRESALVNMPLPMPATVRLRAAALLLDADVDVQIAACHLAGKTKLTEFKQPALKALATARERWLLNALENALWTLGARYEQIEVLASRLDDPAMIPYCLERLGRWVIAGFSWRSTPREGRVDAAAAKALKERWERFLKEHGNALRDGKRFTLGDAALPPDLFPQFVFHPSTARKSKGG
jgi:hypothetical protein